MKTTTFSQLFILSVLLLSCSKVQAQCSPGTGECYIKGDFVEIGIARTGAFGGCNSPAGYHPNVPGFGTALGFVSDPDKDGWLVSGPGRTPYMGDYFVPGAPYEGWQVQVNGVRSPAFPCPGYGSFWPGTGTNTGIVVTPGQQSSTWQGAIGDLAITQTTVVKKDKLYFVMYIDLVNTGATTLNNVYYYRGLDPDNDVMWPRGSFATKNTIVFQPNAISKNCLVTAIGNGYPNAYLGLGTKDCRAKCMYNQTWPPTASLSNMYNETGTASAAAGYYYDVGSTTTRDWGIGVVWNLGNLEPGKRTSLAYTYILKQADLDSALGETEPKFESDGVPYAPHTTFRTCPGKKVPLSISNGGQYKWIWTPGADLTPAGTAVTIPPGGTVPAVTGSRTYPDGGVYGESVEVTVWGPKTYTAMGVSTCDTQYLTFYVDTVTFTTPPSVTTPVRYCEGAAAAALTAGAAPGATLRWYTTGSGGVPDPAAPTPSTDFAGPAGTDFDTLRYWVSQVNTAGCEPPRAQIEVIITRTPEPPVTKDLNYCIGATTEPVTATGTGIKWYDAAEDGTLYSTPPTPPNNPVGTTTYFAAQSINGCESERSPLNVTISDISASFELSEDSLCADELLELTNTSATDPDGDYTSAWAFGDGATAADQNTSHSYAGMRADYTVKLTVTTDGGCADSAQKLVRVFPKPAISFVADTNRICQGDAIDFTGTATPGYTSLLWDFGDGDPAYNTLQVRQAFSKAGVFNIRFSGTFPACDGVNASSQVTVTALPHTNLGPDTSICPGSAAMILKNLNGSAERYLWSTGDSSASISIYHHGDYWFRATNWQCSSTDSITVSKGCHINIPNAFTPGAGNAYNDYFLPRDLLSSSIAAFDMKIFDRWGQLIFETDKTKGMGWDGTYKGQDMPYGVYVYLIKVAFTNGVTESYNGNVTLLR